MKKALFLALVTMLLASCNKDFDASVQPENSEKLIIRASMADPQTKTTVVYGNPDYTQGETSLWSTGDEILIRFTPTGGGSFEDVKFELSSGAGASTAEFTILAGETPPAPGQYDIKAIYPANAESVIDFGDQTQDGFNANHIGKYDYMRVDENNVTASNIDLSFKHMLPMLRFSLKNKTGNDIDIEKISVRSSHGANLFIGSVYSNLGGGPFPEYGVTETSIQCINTPIVGTNTNSHDFYMMLAGNIVNMEADLIVSVQFAEGDIRCVQEFTIPSSEVGFLGSPFVAGQRYYFQLAVTGATTILGYYEGNLLYRLNDVDNTAILIDGTKATGVVSIPATLSTGHKVSSIGASAFSNSGITGLTFASGSELTDIEREAFHNCSDLIGTITIPSEVTSIGVSAFSNSGITGLTFASGSELTDIEWGAFYNCTALIGTITIPAKVTSISELAFYNTGITSITFGSSSEASALTNIKDDAFYDCSGLATINMYCPTPPTLGTPSYINTVFYGTASPLTIHIPVAEVAAYNTELADAAKGWGDSAPALTANIPATFPTLGGATNVVVIPDL